MNLILKGILENDDNLNYLTFFCWIGLNKD